MSWLDNVVAWISPEAGAKRAAWRATYNELRNYDAGNNSRLNAGWRAANYSAEITDRTSRDTIRARVRDLERNSDIANSLISAYKRNVIGAVNAVSAADMALAGIESRVPVDQVIDCMGDVGRRLPVELRETALGGLAATPFGQSVKAKREERRSQEQEL